MNQRKGRIARLRERRAAAELRGLLHDTLGYLCARRDKDLDSYCVKDGLDQPIRASMEPEDAQFVAEVDGLILRLRLAAARADGVPACQKCGCTDADCSGCIERTGMACHWVAADLCSACAEHQPA